jgi:hypothetical protein
MLLRDFPNTILTYLSHSCRSLPLSLRPRLRTHAGLQIRDHRRRGQDDEERAQPYGPGRYRPGQAQGELSLLTWREQLACYFLPLDNSWLAATDPSLTPPDLRRRDAVLLPPLQPLPYRPRQGREAVRVLGPLRV